MKRILLALLLSALAISGDAQYTPGQVLTAAELNAALAAAAAFTPPGIGTVPETITSRLNQTIVLDAGYGADPTGIADSYPAALKAYNYLATIGGGKIHIPTGRFLFKSTLNILSSSIFIEGDGPSATYILNGQSNAPAISYGNGVAQFYGGGVSRLGFTGARGVAGVAGQTGLSVNKFGQARFEDLRFDNSGSALYIGSYWNAVSQSFIHGIETQGSLNVGTYFLNCVDIYAIGGRSDANEADGWLLNGSEGMYLVGLSAYNNKIDGWALTSTSPSTTPNKNNFFIGDIGDTSGSNNWDITDSVLSFFINDWGSTQQSVKVNKSANGFYIGTQYVSDVQFIGGAAVNNNASGVFIDSTVSAPSNISFTDFTFGNTAGSAAGNGKSGSGYGLSASNGSASGIRVNGGRFLGNATSSIYIGIGVDLQVFGNPVGYNNELHGLQTVGSGVATIRVTFATALAASPTQILVTPWFNAGSYYLSGISATGFTINWATATSGTQYVSWSAKI
jgi:hypothetical protein